MASTYSSLKFELPTTGEQDGTWGDTTNTNIGTAIQEAITGSADVTFASGTVTLTLTNTNNTQTARNLRLNLTGTSGGAQNLIVPAIEKQYIVYNGCADTITIKNSTGTGVAVPTGKTMVVFNNGTNVVDVTTHATSLTLGSALPVTSGGTGVTTSTGTGNVVLSTSPTLTTPILGTPTSGTLTNCTGLPISTGVSGLGSGVATFLATPSSSNLAAAVSDETGSGALVFATSPTLVTPVLGTPASGTLTNCTGLPISTGVSGLGSNVAAFLATPSSANLAAALTDETGSGANVFAVSPTLSGTPLAPTASAGTNTTQIATTAFVTTALTNQNLGTMATQNANNVNITGGSITGITDLAIADGGTGASTAADARTNLGLGSLATLSTVTTAYITDSNVTTAKIADANVTAAKLSGAQSGSAPIFGARAWVRFVGTGGLGAQTITGSGNVSSVVRNDTGDYTITFTTAMPNANYCAVGTAIFEDSPTLPMVCFTSGMTTTTVNVYTCRSDTDLPDRRNSGLVNVIVMG